VKMSRLRLCFCFVAAVCSADKSATAEPRTGFIVAMTHAFYAKALCPGVEIVYEDLVSAAQAKGYGIDLVEEVRNGVGYLNTNGQTGNAGSREVMNTIKVAATMVSVDIDKFGVDGWCEFKTKGLQQGGLIRRSQ